MAKIEDQRILVWCNYTLNLKNSILDAVYLAIKLEKEVCLFCNYTFEKDKQVFYNRIGAYAKTIKKDIPDIDVSTLLLKGKLAQLMPELGEKYNAILLVSNRKFNRTLLKAFYRSNFPFFFPMNIKVNSSKFKKIIIPIDFRNNTKDSTLWGSYLGRFNQSEIVLHSANDPQDSEYRNNVNDIVAFVKKFYGQFFYNFWFQQGKSESRKIHIETINLSADFDLCIFTGSLKVSAIDWIIGPFEKRIVKTTKTPVLVINPQKEMYVLCN